MEANDLAEVRNKRRAQQLQPGKVRKKAKALNIPLGSGVSKHDIVIFTRQFATMIDAGLPLVQCLDILGTQNDNRVFKGVIFDVKAAVEGGSTFAEGISQTFPAARVRRSAVLPSKTIRPFLITMIRGEVVSTSSTIWVERMTDMREATAVINWRKRIRSPGSSPAVGSSTIRRSG